ncbi:MAG: SagB/ThcOx family dehydrogenase [Firmicutes bacterium]|nr:SagB/ThcOx family dehydrogenase [Bacillota bacterium]
MENAVSENTQIRPEVKKELISLPMISKKGSLSFEEVLSSRKSVRKFSSKELDWNQTGQLLWAVQGVQFVNKKKKTSPSAGSTYPLTAYVVCSEGVFKYLPEEHKLLVIVQGDHRTALSMAALEQKWVAEAPLSVILTGIYERTEERYGARGRTYVQMEAGHAAQNLHLQAVSLGLGSVPVGAFIDSKVAQIIRCREGEIPLYILPVGYSE